MTELWPCHACDAPGIRNVGAEGYCGTHLAVLYNRFDPAVFADGGVGLPDGLARPEFGPGVQDLRCCACGATWAGIPGEQCQWCQRRLDIQIDYQAEIVLRPPDVEPDDAHYDDRMRAWLQRLKVAEDAGLITRQQVEAAWTRTRRVAA